MCTKGINSDRWISVPRKDASTGKIINDLFEYAIVPMEGGSISDVLKKRRQLGWSIAKKDHIEAVVSLKKEKGVSCFPFLAIENKTVFVSSKDYRIVTYPRENVPADVWALIVRHKSARGRLREMSQILFKKCSPLPRA